MFGRVLTFLLCPHQTGGTQANWLCLSGSSAPAISCIANHPGSQRGEGFAGGVNRGHTREVPGRARRHQSIHFWAQRERWSVDWNICREQSQARSCGSTASKKRREKALKGGGERYLNTAFELKLMKGSLILRKRKPSYFIHPSCRVLFLNLCSQTSIIHHFRLISERFSVMVFSQQQIISKAYIKVLLLLVSDTGSEVESRLLLSF